MKRSSWTRTTLMGIIGGILFGIIIQFWMGNMADVGALYGAHSVVRGWIAHLFHSVIGALLFTALVKRTPLRKYTTKLTGKVTVGLLYGVVLWTVFIALLLPVWLDLMTRWGGGTPLLDSKLRFPASLIGFALYGLIVGGGIHLPSSTVEKEGESRGSDDDHDLPLNADLVEDIDD